MGNNKNNKNTNQKTEAKKLTEKDTVQSTGKKRSGTELFIIIFAAVALVAVIASVIVGVILSAKSKYRVDYMNDDLTKFIYIAESDYKNVSVSIGSVDPVQDFDVENKILQLLCANKDKEAKYEGIYLKNQTISVGDVVNLYYRGYTVDADGNRKDFDGGCNFSSDAAALEIGSGQFVPLFELNLIGKKRPDYSTFKRVDSVGTIGENDKIFIGYTRVLNDGTTKAAKYEAVDLSLGREEIDATYGTLFYDSVVGKQYGTKMEFSVETDNGVETMKNVMIYRTVPAGALIQLNYSAYKYDGTVVQAQSKLIDLSDENLDAVWGKGFTEYFEKGIPVGTKSVNDKGTSDFFTTEVKEGEQNSYFDITVQYVYEVGDNPLTVEAYFPVDYNSKDLQGVTAKFDVYIESVQVYDAPEYNDAFITEKLKLTGEDLAEFEGESLTDKHRASIRAELEAEYNETERTAIISALWELYLGKAQVKKLPTNDVDDFYDLYYTDLSTNYAYYSSSYNSLDAFAREYLGLGSNADWEAELMKYAESAVTEKLVFYYIIRQENLLVPDDEYAVRREKMYNELFESYLESVDFERSDFDDEEKYEKELANYKTAFATKYDEDYYRENVIYEYAFDKLIEFVEIKETTDK